MRAFRIALATPVVWLGLAILFLANPFIWAGQAVLMVARLIGPPLPTEKDTPWPRN